MVIFQLYAESSQTLLTATFGDTYYHCPSVSLFIEKIINEALTVHSMVSLERSRKAHHLPIPILKISLTFNSLDAPDNDLEVDYREIES